MKFYTYILAALFIVPAYAKNNRLVGKLIDSPLRSQVCHLDLENTTGERASCSGVRLSEDYVLTAQHCARNRNGIRNVITMYCNGTRLESDRVYESTSYSKAYQKTAKGQSEVDFAIVKIKYANGFTPKFKLLNNFEEFKDLFLTEKEHSFIFKETTRCEVHGFGRDKDDNSGTLNSANIFSTTSFKDKDYFMSIEQNDLGARIDSPLLPDSEREFLYSSVRPGDSGGPLFCLSGNGEWILAGIASTWTHGGCSGNVTKKSKSLCSSNRWGLPTKEQLEILFNMKLE